MGDVPRNRPATDAAAALALMEQALALLDRCDCASAVGAQLDLAICRLRDLVETGAADPRRIARDSPQAPSPDAPFGRAGVLDGRGGGRT